MSKTLVKSQWKDRVVGFERRPAKDFQANALNFRRHPNNQRDAFRGIVSELGFAGAVLENTRTGNLIDGHLRIEEALSIDESMLIPCVQVDLSEAEEKLLLASYDPISAMATADKETLDLLLKDVSSSDEAVNAMLAKLAEDSGLSYGVKEEDESKVSDLIDRAEELRVKWDTKTGQLWEIGRHRLLVGDATEKANVGRLCGRNRPLLMVTDPPYGLEHDTMWREAAGISSAGPQSARDIKWDDNADWSAAYMVSPADVAYVWHATSFNRVVAVSLEGAGFIVKQQIVWNKSVAAFGRSHYSYKHEPCWYAVRKGKTAKWSGPKNEVTVWDVASPRHIMGGSDEEKQPHSTQKPLECMARPIRNHEGDVYDPFIGSGTTMVAAEQEGRICYAMEIEPKYCAVTLERMTNLGLEARITNG